MPEEFGHDLSHRLSIGAVGFRLLDRVPRGIDREVVEGKREPVAIEDKSASKGGEKEAA